MPDWKKVVRERMTELNLSPDVKEDVIAELASHLEDSELDIDAPPTVSRRVALGHIQWRRLARAIRDAKREEGIMNYRTKVLWLPAMANLILYTGLLFLCALTHATDIWTPRISPASRTPLAAFHPWIFALPLCGAAGALLAKRAEGSFGVRVIAGLAPSLIWLAVFSIVGLVFICDPGDFKGFPVNELAVSAFGWIVVPAMALLIGAIPFLKTPHVQSREDVAP